MALEAISLLWFMLVGLIAGFLADFFVPGISFGLVGDLVIGIVGALIGGVLFAWLGYVAGGLLGTIFVAFVGAVLLLLILRGIQGSTSHQSNRN